MEKEILVISVGGSRIIPNKIDISFLKMLKKEISILARKRKVVICTGGGLVSRQYIDAARKLKLKPFFQDSVGIAATRLNASLVSSMLGANDHIPSSIEEICWLSRKHNIIVCGGMRPGQTSDGTTAEIAAALKARFIINLTNVKGLYDKDPRKYKNARFISEISHAEFAGMIAKIKRKPGQHFVLDYAAALIARHCGISIIITNRLAEIGKFLKGKNFSGTLIH